MKTLRDLYCEHNGKVSDKWSHYLDFYDRRFAEYRDQPVSILEIGIQNGGSLEIWAKYFPRAKAIVGCDINPDCRKLTYADPRIHVFVGDANSDEIQKKITEVSEEYDIVIDDGSHLSGDIVKSFARYFPLVRTPGIFVAEDMHCSYWSEYQGGLYDPYSSMAFFKRIADVIHREHWGVQKKNVEVLNGFMKTYGASIAAEVLDAVSSVEITNSVVTIGKASSESISLGVRVIGGEEELVVKGHHPLNGLPEPAPNEKHNSWSSLETAPEEEWSVLTSTLADREEELAHLASRIQAIEASMSWRITGPLRMGLDLVLGLGHAWKNLIRYVKRNGLGKAFPHAVTILKRHGRYAFMPQSAPTRNIDGRNDYTKWIGQYDTIDQPKRKNIQTKIAQMLHRPLISIVMPTYNPNPAWLSEAIDSVRNQLYPNWELCIADDASTDPGIRPLLEKYMGEEPRIKVVFREENGHISAASNSALAVASGEWVALLDHDDLLPEHALYWVARTINEHSDVSLIYSDEDKVSESGIRYSPYFKPDWNPDLFYSHNLITHLGVYRKDIVDYIGGFRQGFEGAQDYDLALRFVERIELGQIAHIPRILYHWRVHSESTAGGAEAKPYAMLAGERALNDHFERTGKKGRVELVGHGYRARYDISKSPPHVTIIIPVHNGYDIFRTCIESIRRKTTYRPYDLLVIDNRSTEKALLDYLEHIGSEPQIQVIRDDGPFNYSAINNRAVRLARGEYVLLLNSDVEVINEDWLHELVALGIQPGVGAVGACLWYPDNTLQHCGVITGIGGVAAHAHNRLARGSDGYFGRASLIYSVSAVTGACLLVQKDLYTLVGGLNEHELAVAFNDVDFCLKLIRAGYRNVWTPYAELYHHESASRGYEDTPGKKMRFQKEMIYMQETWGDLLVNDPAYNPNLTLQHADFSLAWPPRVHLVH